jgi:2,3-diaminopropionate biosynthesis protein SbnA
VPVVSTPQELIESTVFVDLAPALGRRLHLKCEGFNFAGSVKLRVAAALVAAVEEQGRLGPDTTLIESSSGNLGLAVGVIAASRGLRFVCVTDSRCNPSTLNLLRALGTEVVIVSEEDATGGFLAARVDYVRRMCARHSGYVWLNQYASSANWLAHYELTAVEIAKQFPEVDVVFVGAGTGGTAMGCARYFRDNGNRVRVVAVDAVGSVSFGGPPARRMIPGLGTGVRPALLDPEVLDGVVHVAEEDTIRQCRQLAANGLLFGGSTGSVVVGALRWLAEHDPDGRLTAVAIAPDFADRYADTVYDDRWVTTYFGPDVLATPGKRGIA